MAQYSILCRVLRRDFAGLTEATEQAEIEASRANRGCILHQIVDGRKEIIAVFDPKNGWRPPIGNPQPKAQRAVQVQKFPQIEGYTR